MLEKGEGMSEATTDQQGTSWARYGHRGRPEIEYDVEVESDSGRLTAFLMPEGGYCFRIRTIKNHSHHEEAHRPAYTYMPAEHFFEIYERAA